MYAEFALLSQRRGRRRPAAGRGNSPYEVRRPPPFQSSLRPLSRADSPRKRRTVWLSHVRVACANGRAGRPRFDPLRRLGPSAPRSAHPGLPISGRSSRSAIWPPSLVSLQSTRSGSDRSRCARPGAVAIARRPAVEQSLASPNHRLRVAAAESLAMLGVVQGRGAGAFEFPARRNRQGPAQRGSSDGLGGQRKHFCLI